MSSVESADGRADERAAGEKVGDKPEWGLVLVLFALASLTLRYGGVWNWWALLWAPLYVAALGMAACDWQVLARCRWRMPVKEWVLFGLTHVSALSSFAILVGLLPV
ncbi:hypothetical protein ACH4SP_41370 [Streptomyces sp. NPDC021093]|uniref:hypothetical protein n=1 Tax=Streptomyces sp. NPDC021093 TaxID=3365112 RepID=UPI00378CDFA7